MVLIHGIGSHWKMWAPVMDALASERDVVAIDLPGFGASPPLPDGTTPTVAALTDAVALFIGELGIERPLVAGNSLGGWIALELAKRDLTRGVVTFSPAGFWSRAEEAWLRAQLRIAAFSVRRLRSMTERAAATPAGRRLTGGVFFGHPERIPADAALSNLRALAESPAFDATLAAMAPDRFRDGSAVHDSVTIAWGRLDRLLFPRQALRALAQIPQARYVQLDDAGHVPTWDAPDEVARLILGA